MCFLLIIRLYKLSYRSRKRLFCATLKCWRTNTTSSRVLVLAHIHFWATIINNKNVCLCAGGWCFAFACAIPTRASVSTFALITHHTLWYDVRPCHRFEWKMRMLLLQSCYFADVFFVFIRLFCLSSFAITFTVINRFLSLSLFSVHNAQISYGNMIVVVLSIHFLDGLSMSLPESLIVFAAP